MYIVYDTATDKITSLSYILSDNLTIDEVNSLKLSDGLSDNQAEYRIYDSVKVKSIANDLQNNKHVQLVFDANHNIVDVITVENDDELYLLRIKENKIMELSTECNQTILNGFYSSCRGFEEKFSFSALDQTNIMGYISMLSADATIPIIWKSANENLCTPFTAEQMIQLAKDALTHKQIYIYKFEVLRNQVMNCLDIESVGVITWESII